MKKALIISGIITLVAPMLGLTGTVLGMMGAFGALGKGGGANMEGLSSAISAVLVSAATGLAIGILSFLVFIITLICWLMNRNNPPPLPVR